MAESDHHLASGSPRVGAPMSKERRVYKPRLVGGKALALDSSSKVFLLLQRWHRQEQIAVVLTALMLVVQSRLVPLHGVPHRAGVERPVLLEQHLLATRDGFLRLLQLDVVDPHG